MYKISIIVILIIAFAACSTKQTNPEKWTDTEINTWFEKQEWLGGWNVLPDVSVNRRSLAINYFNNRHYWDEVFQYLKNTDLKALPVSNKHELDGKHILVSVSDYTTKNKSETKYESHKKYIDIQYVIEGEELMGLTTLDKVKVTKPYNGGKDIAFYEYDGGEYIKATPKNFVVFFPEDVHRPGMKVNENSRVKKIVVKILVE